MFNLSVLYLMVLSYLDKIPQAIFLFSFFLNFELHRISSINIFTKNEVLSFALLIPSDDIYKWVQVLRDSAENSSDK